MVIRAFAVDLRLQQGPHGIKKSEVNNKIISKMYYYSTIKAMKRSDEDPGSAPFVLICSSIEWVVSWPMPCPSPKQPTS